MKIFLISAHGFNLIKLLTTLEPETNEITVIGCPKSIFAKNDKQYRFIPIGNHDNCGAFTTELLANTALLETLEGWIIYGDDSTLYEIAHSSLSAERKIEILPIGSIEALSVVGSKAGFTQVSNKYKWKVPHSLVCTSPEDLKRTSTTFGFPFYLKADQGGGGTQVRKIIDSAALADIPEHWFPVVIQEAIEGTECGLGAFFWYGELRFIDFADQLEATEKLGPTYRRRVFIPESFDALDSLQDMGRVLGIHGFVNASTMYDPQRKSYFIFEMDMRPNAWHFLFSKLGHTIGELTRETSSPKEFPLLPIMPNGYVYVHIISRHIGQLLNKRLWRKYWLLALSSRTKKANEIVIDQISLGRYVAMFAVKIASIVLPARMIQALRKKGIAYTIYQVLAKISR